MPRAPPVVASWNSASVPRSQNTRRKEGAVRPRPQERDAGLWRRLPPQPVASRVGDSRTNSTLGDKSWEKTWRTPCILQSYPSTYPCLYCFFFLQFLLWHLGLKRSSLKHFKLKSQRMILPAQRSNKYICGWRQGEVPKYQLYCVHYSFGSKRLDVLFLVLFCEGLALVHSIYIDQYSCYLGPEDNIGLRQELKRLP